MSDDSKERRSSRRGEFAEPGEASPASRSRLPSLDEVFLVDDDLEPGEEDTRTVAAVDVLGPAGDFDLDDETVVSEPVAEPPPPPPSGARLSAPPGVTITVRPRVSAPPMAVPQLRAPVSAPPPSPFMSGPASAPRLDPPAYAPEPASESERFEDDPIEFVPRERLDDRAEYAEPDPALDYDSAPDASEVAEADLYSAPYEDRRPAAQPAQVLRASFSPRESSAAGSALSALFKGKSNPTSSRARPQGVAMGAASVQSPAERVPPALGAPPPPLAHAPPVDRYQAPKTLVSAPSVLPEPVPLPLPPPPKPARRRVALLASLALLAVVGSGFWMLEKSEPGSLLLSASSRSALPLTGLELYLDGELVCRSTPCDIAQLSQGTHFVRAKADGYPASADHAVLVRAREQARYEIALEAPPANARIEITTHIPGFTISVDGTDRGHSPLQLSDLTVGKHLLEVKREGFETLRQEFSVERDEMRALGPLRPALLVGNLELRVAPGFEDASVFLDGERVSLPQSRKLDAKRRYRLTAEKPGFTKFEQDIGFDADNPSVEIRIQLQPEGAPLEASDAIASADRRDNPARGSGAATLGTLNFNSIPSSTVVLDGRPLGQTPVMGVAVSPGPHDVLFVHPERGRKAVQVDVDAGRKRTVSVRF